MVHRGDRTPQLERLARLADGPRASVDPTAVVTDTSAADGDAHARRSLRQRARSAIRRVGPFASGVAAVLVALLLYQQVSPRTAPLTTADIDQRVGVVLSSQVPGPPFSQLAFQVIAPSLVLIKAGAPASADGGADGAGELGSGVVVTPDGGILTALHVVADATSIGLTFADGSTSEAYVADRDPTKDIAMLVADNLPDGVVPAVLGNPGLPVGSDAYVVGSPYGLFGSLSAGVVSGRDRTFRQPNTDTPISGLIQVDAAVNPGNSGGPLLDRAGRVVGIVIALINPSGADTFLGIGLAVPIDVAGGAGGLPPY
jgi:S1-C subfamily serine protease